MRKIKESMRKAVTKFQKAIQHPIVVNIMLTVPALLVGLLCAVVAFAQPIFILWKGEE